MDVLMSPAEGSGLPHTCNSNIMGEQMAKGTGLMTAATYLGFPDGINEGDVRSRLMAARQMAEYAAFNQDFTSIISSIQEAPGLDFESFLITVDQRTSPSAPSLQRPTSPGDTGEEQPPASKCKTSRGGKQLKKKKGAPASHHNWTEGSSAVTPSGNMEPYIENAMIRVLSQEMIRLLSEGTTANDWDSFLKGGIWEGASMAMQTNSLKAISERCARSDALARVVSFVGMISMIHFSAKVKSEDLSIRNKKQMTAKTIIHQHDLNMSETKFKRWLKLGHAYARLAGAGTIYFLIFIASADVKKYFDDMHVTSIDKLANIILNPTTPPWFILETWTNGLAVSKPLPLIFLSFSYSVMYKTFDPQERPPSPCTDIEEDDDDDNDDEILNHPQIDQLRHLLNKLSLDDLDSVYVINTSFDPDLSANRKFRGPRKDRMANYRFTEELRSQAGSHARATSIADLETKLVCLLSTGRKPNVESMISFDPVILENKILHVKDKNGGLLLLYVPNMKEEMRETLLDRVECVWPDLVKNVDTENEGMDHLFDCLHFSMYNWNTTLGTQAPRDVSIMKLRKLDVARAPDVHQYIPRASKELIDHCEEYNVLAEAFADVFVWQSEITANAMNGNITTRSGNKPASASSGAGTVSSIGRGGASGAGRGRGGGASRAGSVGPMAAVAGRGTGQKVKVGSDISTEDMALFCRVKKQLDTQKKSAKDAEDAAISKKNRLLMDAETLPNGAQVAGATRKRRRMVLDDNELDIADDLEPITASLNPPVEEPETAPQEPEEEDEEDEPEERSTRNEDDDDVEMVGDDKFNDKFDEFNNGDRDAYENTFKDNGFQSIPKSTTSTSSVVTYSRDSTPSITMAITGKAGRRTGKITESDFPDLILPLAIALKSRIRYLAAFTKAFPPTALSERVDYAWKAVKEAVNLDGNLQDTYGFIVRDPQMKKNIISFGLYARSGITSPIVSTVRTKMADFYCLGGGNEKIEEDVAWLLKSKAFMYGGVNVAMEHVLKDWSKGDVKAKSPFYEILSQASFARRLENWDKIEQEAPYWPRWWSRQIFSLIVYVQKPEDRTQETTEKDLEKVNFQALNHLAGGPGSAPAAPTAPTAPTAPAAPTALAAPTA
ncbi:unnamed protein product [Cyclocybe aegerita]|uniref:DUF6532 domain-containing protein n=1 Tax=Cyclocybe aegerita TaxID=1973307 RepID=A0A8S0VZ35_CYCAE|nr:unnamed protein product [Cyclocybe aegerita]